MDVYYLDEWILLHCMLLVSYIQQYFNTSITVLTNQVWKLLIALLKVLNTGALTVLLFLEILTYIISCRERKLLLWSRYYVQSSMGNMLWLLFLKWITPILYVYRLVGLNPGHCLIGKLEVVLFGSSFSWDGEGGRHTCWHWMLWAIALIGQTRFDGLNVCLYSQLMFLLSMFCVHVGSVFPSVLQYHLLFSFSNYCWQHSPSDQQLSIWHLPVRWVWSDQCARVMDRAICRWWYQRCYCHSNCITRR